ncbi:MAG: hypothetical protein DWQ18_06625 [Crenarchaeota archaeon]|nr:MAG: hypothetical protein DWQ17_03160 [Thermoproteota archaeon]RDJ32861.1 MAG: hypothetical protein DWQ18_06625 [Thermoproteota archaeon]RDJ38030.1 MAG: hypothetical protein DWQ13_05255 [Thermoproteota archaeon]RDJ38305.1 MAG: hypothetical protein DWQ19_00550 [Thermoproteota archaeon]
MEHVLFCDGDAKKIAWLVKTGEKITKQYRDHAEIYLDIVSPEQSKYIALHVGIFWSIGTFLIKNGDSIKVMLDSKEMFEHLEKNNLVKDEFIEKRTMFIKLLIKQRNLDVSYELINAKENQATPLIQH